MKSWKQTPQRLSVLLLSSLLMACGNGFEAESPSASVPNTGLENGGGPGEQNPPANPEKAWTQVSDNVNGRVDGGTNSGALVVQVDRQRQALVLILPLPPIFLLPISGMSIPELPGASMEMMPQSDGSMAMGVVIPLKYIIKGAQFSEYGRLPNGDSIPFIPVGEARGFALSFPQKPSYRLHLYLAVNAAAVFVETPDWKLPSELSILPTLGFPVKNQNGTQVNGYFAIVPNRGTHASGVYVASRIPRQIAILIDELVRF